MLPYNLIFYLIQTYICTIGNLYFSGFAQAIQNLGLGLISLAVGKITDSYGYFWLEVFMMSCLCVAICTSVLMWMLDYRDSNYLNMTINQRKNFETTTKYKKMMDMEITESNDTGTGNLFNAPEYPEI